MGRLTFAAMPEDTTAATGPIDQPFGEIGNQDLYRFSGFTRDEFLPELQGLRAAEIYREMSENSAIIGAVLMSIEQTLLRVPWRVEEGSGSDAEISAELVRTSMVDMSHSWSDLISSALTMLPYGFAWLETVYKQRVGPEERDPSRRSRYDDGQIGWRKFTLIPAYTVADWVIDDHGGVQAVVQTTPAGNITIPINKSLLFRTTRRRPTGRSILRNSYRSYYLMKRVEEIEGIGVERDLAGLPVFYLDPTILNDTAKRNEYLRIAVNLRRDEQEGVLLPALYDENRNQLVRLELLSAAGQRQFDTNTIIARHTRNIAMTSMQDVLLLGHEKVGTQSLASEKRDLSEVALAAWLEEITNVINEHAIPRLLQLNGLSLQDPPKVVPGSLRESDVLSFTQALRNIARSGFTLAGDPEVENFVRRRLGLPLLEEEPMGPQEAGATFPPQSVPKIPNQDQPPSASNGQESTVGAGDEDVPGEQ